MMLQVGVCVVANLSCLLSCYLVLTHRWCGPCVLLATELEKVGPSVLTLHLLLDICSGKFEGRFGVHSIT
jgi:hypothetical protein